MRVLFLCTGNSCRSQMAEGWARHLHGDKIEAFSAGTHPSHVSPGAIEVMREAGIDISGHRSKSVSTFVGEHFDLVVTLCDNAAQVCPAFPNADRQIHAPFADPFDAVGSPEERLAVFRRVRDQIREFVANLPTA
jgi:arsenate reductase